MTSQQIRIVLLLALLNFTHILDFMIMMPLGNILMIQWNIDATKFSYVVAAYPIAAFVSSLCAFFYADTFPKKKLLLFAYAGFLMATLFCGFSGSYNILLFARIITGLFGGLIGAQVLSIIAETIGYEHRAKAMGLLMGGFALASVIGVPLSLILANTFSWEFPFRFVAIMGLLLYPFLLKFIPYSKANAQKGRGIKAYIKLLFQITTSSTTFTALLLSGLLMMGHFMIIPLLNPFLINNVALSQDAVPWVYGVGGVCSILAGTLIGRLADKYGKYKWLAISGIISLIFVAIITNLQPIPLWLALTIMGLWFFWATGRSVPAQAMISQAVSNEIRGAFMSLNSCIQQLGTGIASLASGWFAYSDTQHYIHHYNYLGYISIIIILTCIYLAKKLNNLIVI